MYIKHETVFGRGKNGISAEGRKFFGISGFHPSPRGAGGGGWVRTKTVFHLIGNEKNGISTLCFTSPLVFYLPL